MAIGFQPNVHNRPPSDWPVRYLNTGLVFLVLSGLAFFDWLTGGIGHYRHNSILLAATHLFVLGFGTLVTLGAMIQMVPVLLGRPIEGERAARIAYAHLVPGIALLVAGFWDWSPWLLGTGGLLIVAGVIIFTIPYWKALWQGRKTPTTDAFMLAALLYLVFTVTMGVLMAFQLISPFWGTLTVRGLPLHVILGVGGWFTVIIVGVSYRLFPMFAAAPGNVEAPARRSFILLNAGILVTLIAWISNLLPGVVFGLVVIGAASVFYALDVVAMLRRRLRRSIGPGIGQAAMAVGYLVLGWLGGMILAISLWHPEIPLTLFTAQRYIIAVGLLLSSGWIGSMILGMLTKISPMILWLHRFAHHTGEANAPTVADLIDEDGMTIGAYLYHGGLIGLVLALVLGYSPAIYISAAVWFVGMLIQAIVLWMVWLTKGGKFRATGRVRNVADGRTEPTDLGSAPVRHGP